IQETVYLGDTPVATIKSGTGYYVYADQIDTPRVITDTNNLMVWRWDQADPFGATLPDENPSGLGAFAYNLRFPGQVYDAETGKHYNANRDYDPASGRYVQSDPIGLNGGQWSTYGYVGGQPTRYADPNGLCIEDLCIGEAIVVGRVAYQGYRAYRTYQAATRIADAIAAAKSNDDDVGGQCKMKNSQKGDGDGGMPGNNQDQNKQAKDAARAAKLDSSQQRELHDAISGQGYNYQQILEIAREIASGMY
ncbi:RHS repeat-associated core domain-containing protein, partial [Ralstonia solanacearum]